MKEGNKNLNVLDEVTESRNFINATERMRVKYSDAMNL